MNSIFGAIWCLTLVVSPGLQAGNLDTSPFAINRIVYKRFMLDRPSVESKEYTHRKSHTRRRNFHIFVLFSGATS